MIANIGADIPRRARSLIRRIAADKKNCRSGERIAQRCGAVCMSGERLGEGDVVRRTVMIDVVGAENGAGELLQQVRLFVGQAIAADDADGLSAARIAEFAETLADVVERFFPAYGLEFAVGLADQRMRDAVVAIGEVEGVASLVAEEVAVDAALVAVVAADDLASRRRWSERRGWSCSRRRSGCRWWRRGSSPRGGSCSGRFRW